MDHPEKWNALKEWKPVKVDWVRVDISAEDLARFTQRSNFKGLCHAIGFLAIIASTGTLAYLCFVERRWVLMAIALYFHGTIYRHFGDALHELSHKTVFASKWLNTVVTAVYGVLYWPWNPHLYRISHLGYHHRYTLYQGSDGEDTPNYVEFTPKLFFNLFFRVFQIKALIQNVARLLTLKPTSKAWRDQSGYRLDTWEQLILENARPDDVRQVKRYAAANFVIHVLFVAGCLYTGYGFLPLLITFAPFYGGSFHTFLCSTHQHAACEPNHPDFRVSCGDAILDPLSSFLYWHMEYHVEHHMFAAIPCYNLKRFREFVAAQLPPREYSIPRLFKLNRVCKAKYGSYQAWRDGFGRFKGF